MWHLSRIRLRMINFHTFRSVILLSKQMICTFMFILCSSSTGSNIFTVSVISISVEQCPDDAGAPDDDSFEDEKETAETRMGTVFSELLFSV